MPQMEFNPAFGKRLQELRHREGKMSLRELAGRVGISPSYLSQIEQGKLPPPRTNLSLIILFAKELNEDPIDLGKLAKQPTHPLIEILSDHPEIPNLIAEELITIPEKHVSPALVESVLQLILREEYGKYLKKPERNEIEALSEQVKRIHKYLRERNKT